MQLLKYNFMVLFIIYLLGEYYIRIPDRENKETEPKGKTDLEEEKVTRFMAGCVLYVVLAAFLTYLVIPGIPQPYSMLFLTALVGIDIVKFVISKNAASIARQPSRSQEKDGTSGSIAVCAGKYMELSDRYEWAFWTADFILHAIFILYIANAIQTIGVGPLYNDRILWYLNGIGVRGSEAICMIAKTLVLCKPCGQLIASVLKKYKFRPEEDNKKKTIDMTGKGKVTIEMPDNGKITVEMEGVAPDSEEDRAQENTEENTSGNTEENVPENTEESAQEKELNVGRYIGYLERILILVFMSIAQYGSIGLVLTAKSIARYNEIANNRRFAEYYLLGTLLSTILAVTVSLILTP